MTLRQLLANSAVKGICVGRCIDGSEWGDRTGSDAGGVWRLRIDGHAHIPGCGHTGWICIRSPNNVLRKGSRHVSQDVMHELCHLISQSGHDDRWRKAMRELGQTIPKQYQKRCRNHPTPA
jgi:hypothetical protein